MKTTMRDALVSALLEHDLDTRFCFLTGDLGFNALEPLRERLGKRFINMGIAEQNMVSVAAGLARGGMRPWVYTIGPFCYARAFEQIRNDICLHNLPICLVGSGGGYYYGVQGPTHHSLEDCAVLGSLQHMTVYVPGFCEDIAPLVRLLVQEHGPAYMRLDRDECTESLTPPPFSPMRMLCRGEAGVVLVLGSLAGSTWEAAMGLPGRLRPSLWCCSRLPRTAQDFPKDLVAQVQAAPWVVVAEEHVASGGLGDAFARLAMENDFVPRRFVHCHSKGYPSGLYGSQLYHRKECGLDAYSLIRLVASLEANP